MEVTIGQFAKLVGSTVRTLRYYDKLGLLTPGKFNNSGRKVYTRSDWEFFQQIMILKHLGLSLNEIKEQMVNQRMKSRELLRLQKQLIKKKQAELNDKLEVITRMDRLYSIEGISEDDLDEFAFIMLDLFRREKSQIQAMEEHFADNKELLEDIKLLYHPDYQEKMDQKVWYLIQTISNTVQNDDPESREKAQEILNEMYNLLPTDRNFLTLIEDENFLAKYKHEFNNYFPENIADYIYKELKAYYGDKNDNS
ncbi:MerR family transcriptional regulator [Jeotgalibacillus proteolyticus]|uniref:MerR family transcriptional regulator n=1 Tax=Jeotgalibacillus proteolyticus TaxID=2082395 RepID=A0A2S5G972_9BACL|nr:MerR family transcriptional regulator [Jeotgalibacillus proteolyticus]PPA69528.1 MerR family transcriptional regulator [Jeotgalibacillus proteolyticus]